MFCGHFSPQKVVFSTHLLFWVFNFYRKSCQNIGSMMLMKHAIMLAGSRWILWV